MGMVVPLAPGQKSQAAPQAQPSQTDLLMALALMHKDGRFAPPKPAEPA
jgi:hypothetical protein